MVESYSGFRLQWVVTETTLAKGTLTMVHSPQTWKDLATQLRADSIRSTTAAGSGHPTSSMSAADLMAVLLAEYLHYDFKDPHNLCNDRLIFSKGHAAP